MSRTFIKHPKCKKSVNASTISRLKDSYGYDLEDGDMFDLEESLEHLETEVLDELGLWLEPSIQLNTGGIWIYTQEDDTTVLSGYDWETYVEYVVDIAAESEDDESFKQAYKSFIERIIDMNGVDDDEDDDW